MISTALALLKTDEQRNVLSEFYQKYKNRFYAIAYSKLHGKAAAEDAVQEAFLRIVDKPENFLKLSITKEWLMQMLLLGTLQLICSTKTMRIKLKN